jgi:hypothetical protein
VLAEHGIRIRFARLSAGRCSRQMWGLRQNRPCADSVKPPWRQGVPLPESGDLARHKTLTAGTQKQPHQGDGPSTVRMSSSRICLAASFLETGPLVEADSGTARSSAEDPERPVLSHLVDGATARILNDSKPLI